MVIISKNPAALIWLAEENVGINTEVQVHDGCVALARRNGAINKWIYPGRSATVNITETSRFRKPVTDNSVWDIIGVDTSSDIEIPWGVCVPYVDANRGLSGELKAHGYVYAKIVNYGTAFNYFFKAGSKGVSAGYIVNTIRERVQADVFNIFKNVLSSSGGYDAMCTQGMSLSRVTEQRLSGLLEQSFGLDVSSVSITIVSDGFEELKKLEQDRVVAGIETDILIKQSEGAKKVLDALCDNDSKNSGGDTISLIKNKENNNV